MEASWHQNRSKIDANCEKRFFEKSCSGSCRGSKIRVRGVQVGNKNRSKIDPKRSSTSEGILAPIFHRFWWILGGKLGPKIEPRSIKNGIEKTEKKRRAPAAPGVPLHAKPGRSNPLPPRGTPPGYARFFDTASLRVAT